MVVFQNFTNPNHVLDALISSVGPETREYRVAVAYVTREGARTVIAALEEEIGPGWKEIPKSLITCFDFGHTEPSALRFLWDQGFELRIANLRGDGSAGLASGLSNFHPKIFLAYESDVVHAVVGSANLSRRAMTVNTEAVAKAELPASGEVVEMWEALVEQSVLLTDGLLTLYEESRPELRAVPRDDELPVPKRKTSDFLSGFPDEVEARRVDPTDYSTFWVEAGFVSGGSGNQLELPRTTQRFFGYTFNRYDDDHHVIGNPELWVGDSSWPCKLTWHGNNRMERINLPTPARSGLVYHHRVVLFYRRDDGFDLSVADEESGSAHAWINESASLGTLYRVSSGRSPRRCGLVE